jgi:branched-chain amino acid transport system substrate-binding protein
LNAATYRPDVLIDLMGGQDQANSLEQIVRYRLSQDMAVGGALYELESIMDVSDAARIGWWTMEWWWDQPDISEVKAFDATIRTRSGRAASARNWFGYAAVHTLARVANQEKSLNPVALARALQGYTLPPDVALGEPAFFRARDHQLMSPVFVGEVHPPRSDPFDVFTALATVKADRTAEPAEASACKLAFPS